MVLKLQIVGQDGEGIAAYCGATGGRQPKAITKVPPGKEEDRQVRTVRQQEARGPVVGEPGHLGL